jgi:ABC-type polysaccharide/polyol phosphate export permease
MLRERGAGWIIDVNPLASFLELIRRPIIDGQLPALGAYGVAALTALAAATLATATLARAERQMIFHL